MCDNPYHVFLIDDDEDDRDLFEDALMEIPTKTRVVTFGSGIELFNFIKDENNQPPQIIFLDLNMPMMSGEECLQKIRENPRFRNLPVVIFSTSIVDPLVNRVKSLGASLYVKKPSSFSSLKSILESCITALLENEIKIGVELDFIVKENL
ncbi:response regulator [Arenibacter sp. BSSL-BM3]|uniref:Response regulator n=1 Tax=Arenibacter arenosicollis TaxID=2762274 RepID=A0ABR7QRG9_9FLAO|nr:response regulator [Arenibacter arenosicollis]MBC8769773.1 response regulator [Arenibacter arenosicollis]